MGSRSIEQNGEPKTDLCLISQKHMDPHKKHRSEPLGHPPGSGKDRKPGTILTVFFSPVSFQREGQEPLPFAQLHSGPLQQLALPASSSGLCKERDIRDGSKVVVVGCCSLGPPQVWGLEQVWGWGQVWVWGKFGIGEKSGWGLVWGWGRWGISLELGGSLRLGASVRLAAGVRLGKSPGLRAGLKLGWAGLGFWGDSLESPGGGKAVVPRGAGLGLSGRSSWGVA